MIDARTDCNNIQENYMRHNGDEHTIMNDKIRQLEKFLQSKTDTSCLIIYFWLRLKMGAYLFQYPQHFLHNYVTVFQRKHITISLQISLVKYLSNKITPDELISLRNCWTNNNSIN